MFIRHLLVLLLNRIMRISLFVSSFKSFALITDFVNFIQNPICFCLYEFIFNKIISLICRSSFLIFKNASNKDFFNVLTVHDTPVRHTYIFSDTFRLDRIA